MSFPTAVPNNCDTFYIADTFIFRAIFTDNVELGSFSLDIHHNFDHHTHSTDMVTCPMEPKKIPVNPFVFIRAFEIPAGLQKYEATVEITVPAGFDTGEYHLFIRLTDKAGWQTVRGINIKGLNKTVLIGAYQLQVIRK